MKPLASEASVTGGNSAATGSATSCAGIRAEAAEKGNVCHAEGDINGVRHICNRPAGHAPPCVMDLFKRDAPYEHPSLATPRPLLWCVAHECPVAQCECPAPPASAAPREPLCIASVTHNPLDCGGCPEHAAPPAPCCSIAASGRVCEHLGVELLAGIETLRREGEPATVAKGYALDRLDRAEKAAERWEKDDEQARECIASLWAALATARDRAEGAERVVKREQERAGSAERRASVLVSELAAERARAERLAEALRGLVRACDLQGSCARSHLQPCMCGFDAARDAARAALEATHG